MDANAIPILRVEIDRLKHAIMVHLGTMGSELGDILEKSVERAVADYDFTGKVRETVHNSLNKEIDNYFTFGPGHQAVKQTVENAFKGLYKDEEEKPL